MASNTHEEAKSAKTAHVSPPDADGGKSPSRRVILELDPKERKTFEKFKKLGSKLRIMVTGPTGAGKSTLLNGIVGEKVFKVGRRTKKPITAHVTEHICCKNGVTIVALDCPGLHDGTDNEDIYIQEMRERIEAHGGIDLILYCRSMNETRADVATEKGIITKLTRGLGVDIWKHSLFVLTFANVYEDLLKEDMHKQENVITKFEQKKKEWRKHFRQVLKQCNIKSRTKICPAGYKQPQLGKSSFWLSDLWATALKIVSKSGAFALYQLNQSRMAEEENVKAEKKIFEKDLDSQPIVLTSKVKKVLGIIGSGSAGTLAGATVGATIGAVFIGVISFGPAAAAGLVIGGVIGAAVGSSIGGSILVLYNRFKNKDSELEAQGTDSDSESEDSACGVSHC